MRCGGRVGTDAAAAIGSSTFLANCLCFRLPLLVVLLPAAYGTPLAGAALFSGFPRVGDAGFPPIASRILLVDAHTHRAHLCTHVPIAKLSALQSHSFTPAL